MFTGIVEEMGTVLAVSPLKIKAPGLLKDAAVGDSIAVDGTCLTVTELKDGWFTADVGPETLKRTTLGSYAPGRKVNLERSLRVGDRLGGHFVTGHIDGVGTILARERHGDTWLLTFQAPEPVAPLLLPQGSVAVDGVSLTVVDVLPGGRFTVMVIPHTAEVTTLGWKGPGDRVNMEADMLGKYVERLVSARLAQASTAQAGTAQKGD